MPRANTLYERVEVVRGHRYIRLKSNRLYSFLDSTKAIDSAMAAIQTALSRGFKLADREFDYTMLEHRLSRLEETVAAMRAYMQTLKEDEAEREKIAALRDTNGRSPVEVPLFLAKADKLESALEERIRKREGRKG